MISRGREGGVWRETPKISADIDESMMGIATFASVYISLESMLSNAETRNVQGLDAFSPHSSASRFVIDASIRNLTAVVSPTLFTCHTFNSHEQPPQ